MPVPRGLTDRGCKMGWIQARVIEEAVLQEVWTIAGSPKYIDDRLANLRGQNQAGAKDLRAEQVSLEKQLERLEKSKQKKVQWMLDAMPMGNVLEECSQEIQSQLDNIKGIKARQLEVTARLEDLGASAIQAEAIVNYLRCFSDSFAALEVGRKLYWSRAWSRR